MTQPENQAEALDFAAAIASEIEVLLSEERQGAFIGSRQVKAIRDIEERIRSALASLPEAPAVPVVGAAEKALSAVFAIRAEGTSQNETGYGPPYGPPYCIIDASTAEPEVNWPGELIEQVDDVAKVSERVRAAQVSALRSALQSSLPVKAAPDVNDLIKRLRNDDTSMDFPEWCRQKRVLCDEAADALAALASPRPAASDAGVRADAEFLLDRLAEFEREIDGDWPFVTYNGHVSPAIARLRSSLSLAAKRGQG